MKKLLWLSYLIVPLIVIGCLKPQAAQPTTPPYIPHNITTVQPVPTFNRIVVIGNASINVVPNSRHHQVTLHGEESDLSQVSVNVYNDTLFINIKATYPKFTPITATITTRYLNSIMLNGNGNVVAHQLRSPVFDLILNNSGNAALDGRIGLRKLVVNSNGVISINGIDSRHLNIKMHGSPKLILNGMANLKTLTSSGNGTMNLYWVASDELIIKASDQSVIQLAGITDKLYLCLRGRAVFSGKYLRVNKLYAKTYDSSHADVFALKSQSTVAFGHSTIFYFNHPNFTANFMANFGAVLDAKRVW